MVWFLVCGGRYEAGLTQNSHYAVEVLSLQLQSVLVNSYVSCQGVLEQDPVSH